MTVALWRIAAETRGYMASDITGNGAKQTGGRWNNPGTAVVYTSGSIALAVLESLVHDRVISLPYDRFLVRIDVPGTTWALRQTLSPPGGWDAVPEGMSSKSTGDDWVAGKQSAVLLVPSVIVPEEFNVLINPSHPDSSTIVATTVKRWMYDPRLFSKSSHLDPV